MIQNSNWPVYLKSVCLEIEICGLFFIFTPTVMIGLVQQPSKLKKTKQKWMKNKEASKTETKAELKKRKHRLVSASDKCKFYRSGKLDSSANHSSVPS